MTEQPVHARVTRRFDQSPEYVYDAFLDIEKARQFMFTTPTGQMVRAEVDARVGGKYVFVDRRNGDDIKHTGEYLEIDRPRRLVFTFSVESMESDRVIVEIAALEHGCRLTLTHEMKPEWVDYKNRTEEGWRSILDGLATTIE